MNKFKRERSREIELIERGNELIWKVVHLPPYETPDEVSVATLQQVACHTLSAGFPVLYGTQDDKNNLLHKLLSNGKSVVVLSPLK